MDSTSSRNASVCVSPVSSVAMPANIAARTSAVTTHTRRGRRATRSPTRRHTPCSSVRPPSPKRGMPLWPPKIFGCQKTHRPHTTSSAGSSVSIVVIATNTPSAPIGPRPAVPSTSAMLRHSSAAITVQPEATMAGPAVRSACAIASCLFGWRRSSSR